MFVRVVRDSSCIESIEFAKAINDFDRHLAMPVDWMATRLREEAIQNILTGTPPTGIINRFLNLWSNFPKGPDPILSCYQNDPQLTTPYILQILELTLIAADLSGDKDAIQKSVYNICRFITVSDYSNAPNVSEPEFDSFFGDYLQDLESNLRGFRGILCRVIINNPDLMPVLEQHTNPFPELQVLLYRDFLNYFAYKSTLTTSELRIACAIQVGADRIMKLIEEKYTTSDEEDALFGVTANHSQEVHPAGSVFNDKLALVRACFNARHVSPFHAADYCSTTSEVEHSALVRAFMIKHQDRLEFTVETPEALMSEPEFLQLEKSLAFRTLFVSELVDLRLLKVAEDYFNYLDANVAQFASHQTFRLTFLCKLVNGFAEVNFLKANHYLEQVCNYLDLAETQEVMLNEIFKSLKPSFEVSFVQERLLREFTTRFSQEAIDLVDLENLDDFYQGLIISKRFDRLEEFSSYLATFCDETDLLVNACLEGVANLYERQEFDAATQAFELACHYCKLDPDRPKINWQVVLVESFSENQVMHFLRSALMIRSFGFIRHVLKGFELAVNNCKDEERASKIASGVIFILSEDQLRRSGHLAHPLLQRYFDNYLGILGLRALDE